MILLGFYWDFTRKGRGTYLSLIFLRVATYLPFKKIERCRNSWRCAELAGKGYTCPGTWLPEFEQLTAALREHYDESLNDRILPCTAAFDSVGESIPCGNCTHRILFGFFHRSV